MNGLPFNADTVFRFRQGREDIAAQAVGVLDLGARSRVVLLDTAERHWVVEVDPKGALTTVVAGPVTGAEALHAAECIIAGVPDHGSVSHLVKVLAIGLVTQALQAQRRAA